MLYQMETAKESIYWESYIFHDDTKSEYNFIETLAKKAKEGVRVRIVLDGFGSIFLSASATEQLTSAGAELLFFKSIFRRIHRKILIIDEVKMFVGGVNVGYAYKKWFDLHLFIENRRAVKSLLWSFSRSYALCGGKDKNLLEIRESSPSRKTKVWLIDHFPSVGKFLLRDYYEEKIAKASREIVMITPYFVPRSWLVSSLEGAIKRGVKIEILVGERTDSKIMDFTNCLFMASVFPLGIKFFLTKGINHAKAVLIDGEEGMIGSNNLDSLSFHFNAEAGISFKNKLMIKDFEEIIDKWKKTAKLFDPKQLANKWYTRPLEWLIKLVSPVL